MGHLVWGDLRLLGVGIPFDFLALLSGAATA
jgi:hypothetical protein